MSKKPRVLWFVNRAVSSKELENQFEQAGKVWLATLAKVVLENCELHVCAVDPNGREEVGVITTHFVRPKYWRLKLVLNLFYPLFSPKDNLIPQALEIVKKVQPDIIHIHGTEQEWVKLAYELRD